MQQPLFQGGETGWVHYVYDWCMARLRTNIEIDETSLRAVMERFGLRTKTEAVDLALRHLAGQPMTGEEALAMHGARAIEDSVEDVSPRGAA
jgi:Arc/MetJ family transcription regulator